LKKKYQNVSDPGRTDVKSGEFHVIFFFRSKALANLLLVVFDSETKGEPSKWTVQDPTCFGNMGLGKGFLFLTVKSLVVPINSPLCESTLAFNQRDVVQHRQLLYF